MDVIQGKYVEHSRSIHSLVHTTMIDQTRTPMITPSPPVEWSVLHTGCGPSLPCCEPYHGGGAPGPGSLATGTHIYPNPIQGTRPGALQLPCRMGLALQATALTMQSIAFFKFLFKSFSSILILY